MLPLTLPLGIIAGGGTLPKKLVTYCQSQKHPFFVIALDGFANPDDYTGTPHEQLGLGAVGKAISLLKQHDVGQIVLAGSVKNPSLSSLRPDPLGVKLMAQLSLKMFRGDDVVLSTVINFFEKQGFSIIGAEDILKELLMPTGTLGDHAPNESDRHDISFAFNAAKTIGVFDIGQSVVVQQGRILGVEAAEGTDKLIHRCKALIDNEHDEPGAILVKCKKPQQDSRVDLPTIGVDTIENLAQAGFRGIAVEANQAFILDREHVITRANQLDLFIVGVSDLPKSA